MTSCDPLRMTRNDILSGGPVFGVHYTALNIVCDWSQYALLTFIWQFRQLEIHISSDDSINCEMTHKSARQLSYRTAAKGDDKRFEKTEILCRHHEPKRSLVLQDDENRHNSIPNDGGFVSLHDRITQSHYLACWR